MFGTPGLILGTPGLWICAILLSGCAGDDLPRTSRPSPDPAVESEARQASAEGDSRPAIVFLGNSLTAGLGVGPREAFPALIQERIDAAGLDFRVVNAGISGETTAGGLRRVASLVEQGPSVLVISLGGNDALRGVPPANMRSNLQETVDRARESSPTPTIVLVGMAAPPNMGDEYANEFAAVFTELAEENATALVPFLLEGVAADPDLNQSDGIHPTAAGHRIMAETVWEVVGPLLQSRAKAGSDT